MRHLGGQDFHSVGCCCSHLFPTMFAVPIIPEYLYELEHPEHAAGNFSGIAVTLTPVTATVATSPIWADEEDAPRPDQYYLPSTLQLAPLSTTKKPSRRKTTTLLPVTNATTLSPEDILIRHEELMEVSLRVGVLFASKAGMQLIANPFVGHLTNKIGYSIPMFTGFCIMFVSTISKTSFLHKSRIKSKLKSLVNLTTETYIH